MNLLAAGQSGFGKSYTSQYVIEDNLDQGEYDSVIVLDYCDEYRGLVKSGYCSHWIVGPIEEQWSVRQWADFLRRNPNIVLTKLEDLSDERWREICATIISAIRSLSLSTMTVVDEAHFVAPQDTKLLEPIKGLATTGRGADRSAMWITQRLQEIDETIISQCTARILGGFQNSSDRGKLKGPVEYPIEAHNPGGHAVAGLPEELHAPDAGAISVRKFTDDAGDVYGSEWLYSDDSGEMYRIDTRDVDMQSTHYGAQGKPIHIPFNR